MTDTAFTYIVHFYVAILFTFSVVLLTISGNLSRRSTLFWVAANFVGGAAIEVFLIGEIRFKYNFHTIIFILQTLSPTIKFISISNGFNERRVKITVLFIITYLIFISLFNNLFANKEFNLFLENFGTLFAIFCCLLAIGRNRYWSGWAGRGLMAFQFSLAIVTSFFRVGEIWQRDTVYLFVDARDNPLIWLLFLAALSFMSQLAFLLMLASRTERHAHIKQRRMERIRARSLSLLGQNREISRLLDEQRRLLETLTHEVRQPINNAQAALQGIISDLQPAYANQNRVLPVAIRIQGILDDITLSLSNAIVGATLVERGEGAKMRDCEIISIAQLALLDCPEGARERIVFDFPANDILLPVDPILLRLALRNLLDNAAKFSPPGTEIIFSISLDEARLGILIAVTSCVEKSFIFADGMLERGKRGQNAEGKDGSGFGLYIVNEIARIHGQNMVVEAAEPGKVTFGIVLPE